MSLGVLGDYVTLDAGTGAVHTAPGHGADDFKTGMRYGLDIYAPVGPAGHFLDTVELFGGQRVFDANPERRGGAASAGPALASRDVLAPVPALLAVPQPGDLPGDVAVVHRPRHGPIAVGQDAATGRARRDRPRRAVGPGVGARPHVQHGRAPPRLVHLAAARLGRADPRGRLHEMRRGDHHAGARREGGRRLRAVRRRRLVRTADGGLHPRRLRLPDVRRHRVRARDEHPRRLVRLGIEPRGRAVGVARARPGRPTSTSKAATSIAAGSRAR